MRSSFEITNECPACLGRGRRLYSSGATWRGGMGTASMEVDQCDVCWGSGDADCHWPDVRILEAARRDWEAGECAKWLARRAGLELTSFKSAVLAVVDVLAKESRRRKTPPGVDGLSYTCATEALSSTLRDLAK